MQQAGSVYSEAFSLLCLLFDFALQCGGGTELRLVRCQDHLGQVTIAIKLFLSFLYLLISLVLHNSLYQSLPDHQCSLERRPEDSRRCQTQACRSNIRRRRFLWKVG